MNGSIKITIELHTLKYLAETVKIIEWTAHRSKEDHIRENLKWHISILKQLHEKIGVVDNGNSVKD